MSKWAHTMKSNLASWHHSVLCFKSIKRQKIAEVKPTPISVHALKWLHQHSKRKTRRLWSEKSPLLSDLQELTAKCNFRSFGFIAKFNLLFWCFSVKKNPTHLWAQRYLITANAKVSSLLRAIAASVQLFRDSWVRNWINQMVSRCHVTADKH